MTSEAFAWVWLPGATDPVPAGRLDEHADGTVTFAYGRSYLARPGAVALYLPELPLVAGARQGLAGGMPLCVADAGPDAWGRRVVEHRLATGDAELGPFVYLLESGSDRIGALDFQRSPTDYVPRGGPAALDELVRAAALVEAGEALPPELDAAMLQGSSIGGARPKALLGAGDRRLIAKFESSQDTQPWVKGEFVAMELANRVGLDVAPVEFARSLGRDVLLVERFDRGPGATRRMMVSALTVLGLDDWPGGRHASYFALADAIRQRFEDPDATLRELFARIVFNILVGNTDDHGKNHSAFWDGRGLTLTPAYDITPSARSGETAAQAMAVGPGDRASQLGVCVRHCETYHVDVHDARSIIAAQVDTIRHDWDEVCDLAELTAVERAGFWQRQFLNPFVFYGLD